MVSIGQKSVVIVQLLANVITILQGMYEIPPTPLNVITKAYPIAIQYI